MTNLLKGYQEFINNELTNIVNMNISEEEKINKVSKFIEDQVSQNALLFDSSLENTKGYKNEKGGLRND